MPTTITAPATQALYNTAGLQLAFLLGDLSRALMDGLSTIPDMGDPIDLSGQSSLSMRLPVYAGVAFDQAFAASGSETSLNAADTYTLDYSSVSVAQYDLSYTQSVQNQVIQGDGKILTLDDLKTMIPDNVIRTLRGLYCTAGSGISAVTVGDPTLDLDADDAYDLAGQITLRAGAAALGMPTLTLAPQQWNTLRNAFRSEPAFVQNLQAFQAVQRGGGQLLGDVLGLGFGIQLTDSVVTSGGAYKGFCVSPGSIVRVKADPSRARLPAAANPIFLPDFGVVCYELLDGLSSARLGWQALGFFGAALRLNAVSFQALVTSKV
jgi:hypothetical protein